MTELSFAANSLSELQYNDEVWIGDTPYFVRQFRRGGMGLVVFLRRDDERAPFSTRALLHGPNVAIKTALRSDDDLSTSDLFQRELTVWAGLDHPNIIRLNEVLTTRSDGMVAAMDWCMGSLRQLLDDHMSVSLEDALFIIRDLVNGLHFAFKEHGVLHLDLKPENILNQYVLSRMSSNEDDPVRQFAWKVSDWGLASIKNAALANLTSMPAKNNEFVTLNNLGTVSYMAPERFVYGTRSSVGSDLFAVGLVLYEMLIGGLPYQANSSVIEQICSHSYFSVAKMMLSQERVPKLMAEIILHLITPNPNERCSSYPELLKRLEQVQRPRSLLSRLFKS